ncbi:MAG: response regulator [Acidobacteria bacterium]|nr:response regulator [Acidobacteriota bacterium]
MQQVRILYVEDYDLVLFTVKQLLEGENWRVEVCRDGPAALKKIESEESYNLLILDEHLEGINGMELLRRARQSRLLRETPAVMFTASPCEEEALAAGADAFLRKPSGLKDLIPTCRRLLKLEEDESDFGKARVKITGGGLR